MPHSLPPAAVSASCRLRRVRRRGVAVPGACGTRRRPGRAYERLDARERLRLADLAMDLARLAGASYADLRITRYRWQELTARDGRLDHIQSGSNVGFDVRFLIDGAWGLRRRPDGR